jgi:hypothetical protein
MSFKALTGCAKKFGEMKTGGLRGERLRLGFC